MSQDIKIWGVIDKDCLKEINKTKLNLEERIEKWLENDISMLSNDLLVIGRQIETDFGGIIDLLCVDHSGDIVIVELKRDKTPREITAQILDYASWVKDLSNEKIVEIADRYLGDSSPEPSILLKYLTSSTSRNGARRDLKEYHTPHEPAFALFLFGGAPRRESALQRIGSGYSLNF